MYDVIIVGGGPAGLTAGIYAARRALKTLVLSRDIGGQASKAWDVENYPGFEKISGADLCNNFFNQVKLFGTEVKFEEAKSIQKKSEGFKLKTGSNVYESKTIILASGKKPRELGVPGEEEFKGKGVSYCATCDGPFFKEKTIAIIGGGNSALDAALYCSKICQKIYLIYRGTTFPAEQFLIEKVKAETKIETLLESEIAQISGSQTVEKIELKSGKSLSVSGVIVEIGYIVDRTILENFVELNEKGQVKTNSRQETSVPGVFAAGDITDTAYKQIIIAAGEGAKAALSAFDFIQKKEGKKGIVGDWEKKNKK
jgi:thioredoxin-disulfide reductase